MLEYIMYIETERCIRLLVVAIRGRAQTYTHTPKT